MGGGLVEGEGFELAVGVHDEGAAGGFVAAAGLHADEAVFDEVDAADAVLGSDFVELFEEGEGGFGGLAVDGDGGAGFKADGHFAGLVGGLLRATW